MIPFIQGGRQADCSSHQSTLVLALPEPKQPRPRPQPPAPTPAPNDPCPHPETCCDGKARAQCSATPASIHKCNRADTIEPCTHTGPPDPTPRRDQTNPAKPYPQLLMHTAQLRPLLTKPDTLPFNVPNPKAIHLMKISLKQ
ncbi:hypothetical protein CRENBAI_009580 [Crenichthys baileyi]|uniref:Uncharacterized protein n=1 Tax=Crenichthys baileyi TaxID=28760 RepID=A0AAV9RKJ2_9TELE